MYCWALSKKIYIRRINLAFYDTVDTRWIWITVNTAPKSVYFSLPNSVIDGNSISTQLSDSIIILTPYNKNLQLAKIYLEWKS